VFAKNRYDNMRYIHKTPPNQERKIDLENKYYILNSHLRE